MQIEHIGGKASARQELVLAANVFPSKPTRSLSETLMTEESQPAPKSTRGFASMDLEKRRAIARKGGESVPNEKRSFSQNPELASQAGRKGGQSVNPEKRSFSQDHRLAAQAGRKGGHASHGGSRAMKPDH